MADYSYSGTGAANAQAQSQNNLGAQATKRDTISGVAVDLERNVERLAKLYDALRHIGDRIDGTKPESIGDKAGAEVPPASMILDLRRKHGALSNLIGRCEDETQRLAQAIGIS